MTDEEHAGRIRAAEKALAEAIVSTCNTLKARKDDLSAAIDAARSAGLNVRAHFNPICPWIPEMEQEIQPIAVQRVISL